MSMERTTMSGWRRTAGWTQADAARALGLSLRTYQRLEAGEHIGGDPMGLRAELAAQLSAALGTRLSGQWDLQPGNGGRNRAGGRARR